MSRLRSVAVVLFAILFLAATGCKENDDADNANAPKDIQLILHAYNISTGPIGSPYTINTKTMGSTQIASNGMDLSGVEKSIFILREKNSGSAFGKYKGSTPNGTLSLFIYNSDAPGDVAEFDILFPNTSNGVDYQGLESYVHPGAMSFSRTIKHVDRGQTGDESILISAVDQVNQAMNPFGIKYGEAVWVGPSESSDCECGFGPGPQNTDGWHEGNWWVVNNRPAPNIPPRHAMVGISIAEHFELKNATDNIYGLPSSMSLQTLGTVTPKGADIIAYFAARNGK